MRTKKPMKKEIQDGFSLGYASDELKNNKDVVLEAVKQMVVLLNLHHNN